MSIDSQLLNLTGGIKTSGHIKSNFGATIGVGTDAPTGIVEVQHSQPTLVVQQQATSGGSVTSYGKVHAASGTLHIQSGVDATSDSKGDIVLGSVGSGTKHVVVKGATSRVGIGSDAPAYGLDVVPESRFAGNVITSNISANILTLNELSLGVTQGLDNVVNVDNTTANTIAMSNVNESTSRTTGALTVAGGIGVGGNVHCANLYASNITMNLVSFSGLQTFEQVVNNGRVLNSNVLIISNATPSTSSTTGALTLTGGGLGVAGNVHIGSNLTVTDETTLSNLTVTEETALANISVTGETVEVANLAVTSGSLELTQVANVFQVKSSSNVVTEYVRSKKLIKYPRVAMTANSSGGYTASASNENTGAQRYAYKAFDNNIVTEWQMSGTNNSSAEGYDLTSPYNANSNSPTITDNNGNDHTGAWVKLQLPGAIKISSMYIRAPSSNRRPNSAVLLGSNDDSTWYVIKDTFTVANQDENTISVTESSYYQYVMLLVKSLTGNEGQLQIKEIEYYGIPEYDPDAHGTDVIARSVPNVPNTDWLEVYYDGQDYTSMPSTITDKSGNSVTGTPTNGVTFDSTWKAFSFDGVNDYIRGTISGVTGDYIHSASLWIKLADTDDIIFEISGATRAANSIIGLYVDADGTLAYYFYNNDARYNTNLQIGQWYHVGLTYHGGGERRVYVNGVQATFKTSYGTLTNSLTLTGGTLTIGNQIDLAGNYLKGSIANFRLFNRALTADEVWQLYAYQKDYFQVSPDVVTFKGGRLGIGTLEPKAVLDVRGDIYRNGVPAFPIPTAHFYKQDSSTTETGHSENIQGGWVAFTHAPRTLPGVIEEYSLTGANSNTDGGNSGLVVKLCKEGLYKIEFSCGIATQSSIDSHMDINIWSVGTNFIPENTGTSRIGLGNAYGSAVINAQSGSTAARLFYRHEIMSVTKAPGYVYAYMIPNNWSTSDFQFSTWGHTPYATMNVMYLG